MTANQTQTHISQPAAQMELSCGYEDFCYAPRFASKSAKEFAKHEGLRWNASRGVWTGTAAQMAAFRTSLTEAVSDMESWLNRKPRGASINASEQRSHCDRLRRVIAVIPV